MDKSSGRGLNHLLNERARSLRVLRRNSKVVKSMIYLTVGLPLIVNVVRLGLAAKGGSIAAAALNAIDFLIAVSFTAAFVILWRRFNQVQPDDRSVARAPIELETIIKRDLADFAAKLRVPIEHIRILVSRRDLSSAPSMVETGGNLSLTIPLGFLKIRNTDAAPALAMLKHELAHAEQRDTKMWALSAVYWKLYMHWYFPLVVAIFLFHLTGLSLSIVHNQLAASRIATAAARAHAVNETNYDEQVRAIESVAKNVSADQSNDQMSAEIRKFSVDTQIDIAADKELSAQTQDVLPSAIRCIVGSFYVIFLLMSFGAVRSLRRLSEHMADLAVIIDGDGPALQTALSRFRVARRRFRMFALHPSDNSRLTWIEARLGKM